MTHTNKSRPTLFRLMPLPDPPAFLHIDKFHQIAILSVFRVKRNKSPSLIFFNLPWPFWSSKRRSLLSKRLCYFSYSRVSNHRDTDIDFVDDRNPRPRQFLRLLSACFKTISHTQIHSVFANNALSQQSVRLDITFSSNARNTCKQNCQPTRSSAKIYGKR